MGVAGLVSWVATVLPPSLAPATTAVADETAPSVVVLEPAPPAGGLVGGELEGSGRDCKDRCQRKARRSYEACKEKGGADERCARLARKQLAECLTRCKTVRPKPAPCQARCRLKAERTYRACIAKGGAPERCRARAHTVLEDCVATCRQGPGECERECMRLGHDQYNTCVANGGSREECAKEARETNTA